MLNPQLTEVPGGKVKLTWTPDLTGQGYQLFVDGEAVSRTFKPDAASTIFSKPDSNQHSYGVQKMDVVDAIEEVAFPAVPDPDPDPNPDPDPDPDPDPTPTPTPPTGDNVILVNQKWSPTGNWGTKNVVDVRIMDTSVRRDAIQLAGSGTVKRVYVEQHSGDGIKIGQATTGPIVLGSYNEQSELLMYEKYGDVHSDNCQAMGGHKVTFIGFLSKKYVRSNSVFFANEGAGGQGKPEDIVWTFSVLFGMRAEGDHRGGTPIKINDSIRCGIRHCLVVYSGLVPALTTSAVVTDPVVEDSYAITHANWDATGGNLRHRDLWNADGSHKPALDALISGGKAVLLSA